MGIALHGSMEKAYGSKKMRKFVFVESYAIHIRRYIEDKYIYIYIYLCTYNRFSTHNELTMRERFEFGCFRVTLAF